MYNSYVNLKRNSGKCNGNEITVTISLILSHEDCTIICSYTYIHIQRVSDVLDVILRACSEWKTENF